MLYINVAPYSVTLRCESTGPARSGRTL
jgi:hypothetical protein